MDTTKHETIESLTSHPHWVLEVDTVYGDCQDWHFDANGYADALAQAKAKLDEHMRFDEEAVIEFAQLRPYGLNWDSGIELVQATDELAQDFLTNKEYGL